MTIGEQFLWGCVGSLAVEIVKIHWLYGMARRLPARYGRPVFWIARSLLALTGGGLAVAYRIETPVLALHLGAATPLIVQALAQNLGRLLAERDEDRDARGAPPGKPGGPGPGVCPQCQRCGAGAATCRSRRTPVRPPSSQRNGRRRTPRT